MAPLVWKSLLYHCLNVILNCVFVYFYTPPSSPPAIFYKLCDVLLSVMHSYFSNFVLLCDFNVNFDTSHSFYLYLSDLMTSFSLSQVVDTPTHFSPNGQSTLIDLVFVSNLHSFSNCSIIPQLSNSDQLGLMVTLKHQHVGSKSLEVQACWFW